MTYSLNARRSSISCDACSRRASADRSRSASDPESSATARKPKTLMAIVYWANRPGGSGAAPPSHADSAPAYCAPTSARYSPAVTAASCSAPRRKRIMLAAMIGST